MATFPDYNYTISGYSYTVDPVVSRVQFNSLNSRQRKLFNKDSDVFQISLALTSAQVVEFESFISDNAGDEFSVHYFDHDLKSNGTGLIVNGDYALSYLTPDYWEVKYRVEIIDRDMTDQQNIYEVVNEYSGFDGASSALDALEQMINFNNL